MAKVTIVVGVILMVVGATGFQLTGSAHPTALIPALIGLILVIAGILARKPERRMLWMHIAVSVGLLGFVMTTPSIVNEIRLATGTKLPAPIAIEEKFATCVICLVFVAACVRSFIQARRARTAEAAVEA